MEAPQCTRGFFLPLEAALEADAEVVQAEKTRLAALRDAQPGLCVRRHRCAQAESERQKREGPLLHLRDLLIWTGNLLRAPWFVEVVCTILRRRKRLPHEGQGHRPLAGKGIPVKHF